MRVTYKLTLLGAALVLIAAACSDDDASSEAADAATVATTSATTAAPSTTEAVLATPLPGDVTETYTFPDTGYSIDYPAGWFVRTNAPVTFIAQTEEQLESRFVDPMPPNTALSIGFDHRTVLFLQSIGLTSDDPTAQDLLEFNIANFNWTVLRDVGEVEVLGTTAAVVRVKDPDGDVSIQYQGIHPDSGEVFLFGIGGPTEAEVDAFLPTWETIIESITAPEEASAALAAPRPADVTETYAIPDFGYSIDYPAGWFVRTTGPFTTITRIEQQGEFDFDSSPLLDLSVSLDHRTILFLMDIGLTEEDPTTQDLLEFNIFSFDWTDVRDMGEVEIFGTTAAVVRVRTRGGDAAIMYQGVNPGSVFGEFFVFGVGAPTEEQLDAFLPAWETMIESITATE